MTDTPEIDTDVTPSDAFQAAVDATLMRAAQIITGLDDVSPRPGQQALAHDVMEAFLSRGQAAGAAPTGVGKSLAYSLPAAVASALLDERTVISTESLNLQSQLVDKDLPVVVQAVEEVTGHEVSFALLKGWSNYVCVASAVHEVPGAMSVTSALAGVSDPFLRGILETCLDEDSVGDRAVVAPDAPDEEWARVSVSSDECPGVKKCPFGESCRPSKAREDAGHSDIIVTNHSLLAIQAVRGAPVVIRNNTLGTVDHLVVDEAHGLPGIVRSQGASALGGMGLFDLLRSIERLHPSNPGRTKSLRSTGIDLIKRLDATLASRLGRHLEVTVTASNPAISDDLSSNIETWLDVARGLVPAPESSSVMSEIRARRRALSRIESLKEALTRNSSDAADIARWIDIDNRAKNPPTGLEALVGATARFSPVDVAGLLRGNLYEADESTATSIVAVSATLPQSVVVDLGLDARRREYESPFADAYSSSALYVPKVSRDDLNQIAMMRDGRPQFSTSQHAEWSADQAVALAGANPGSSLILAATTANGRRYADELRRRLPGVRVYSQWDGGPTRGIVARWSDEERAILVGTRSMMTGVDSRDHCTLVIIDRVPRSAGNPVDDARVATLQERLDLDRWGADRLVYVADAALLLAQAAGRLIRSTHAWGMVAVLDPRLLKSSPNGLRYPEPTRQALMEPLMKFENKMTSLRDATEWLQREWAVRS